MSSRLRTTMVLPALHQKTNSLRNVTVVMWNSFLRQRRQCDSIITGQHRRPHSSRSLLPFRTTMVQHIHINPCSQTHIFRLVSANTLVSSQSKVIFPIYKPIVSCQYIRSFHATPNSPSDAATATAAEVSSPPADSTSEVPPILWTTHRLKTEQIQKVDSIFHRILWLDLFEASMLNEIVNEKMGVSLNNKQKRQLNQLMEQRAQEAVGNTSLNGSSGAAAEEVEAGPVLVDMKLASFDAASKIKVIKEVRSILNLGLKEAKEMVESAPVTLQKGMKQELAEELKAKLEAVGAKIEFV